MLRRLVVLVLALASLAAPLSARADDLADEAEFRFRRGAELYAKRDYQGALDEFFTSNRLVHNHNVAFNIARTLEQLNRVEEAYRWYAGMLEENIPAGDRKDVLESIQRLSAKVALVRVESRSAGRDDLRRPQGSGRTGHHAAHPRAAAQAGEDHPRAARALLAGEGRLAGDGQAAPRLARAAHDLRQGEAEPEPARGDGASGEGRRRAAPRWRTGRPRPARDLGGRAGLRATDAGRERPAEGTAEVKAALVPRPPPTGALVVRANVDGALIIVDGKESGFTPGVVEGVTVGKHAVSIDAEGRERFTRDVDVVANERSFVDAHLRYAGPSVEAATKSLARASDAPGSITVITREELRAFGYQTVAEALRAVRGIFVSDDRSYTTLGFRGISPLGDYNNRVLILVDGHAVYDPWVDQGYVARDLDVDLDDVERIEVVRGGGSALYGTGAVFGVINVVHRAPDEGGTWTSRAAWATWRRSTDVRRRRLARAASALCDGRDVRLRGRRHLPLARAHQRLDARARQRRRARLPRRAAAARRRLPAPGRLQRPPQGLAHRPVRRALRLPPALRSTAWASWRPATSTASTRGRTSPPAATTTARASTARTPPRATHRIHPHHPRPGRRGLGGCGAPGPASGAGAQPPEPGPSGRAPLQRGDLVRDRRHLRIHDTARRASARRT